MTTTEADPRSVELGVDRWLTDARAYNLLWLGRWLERAYEICRELLWLAQQEADESAALDAAALLGSAAGARGMSVDEGSTPLAALLSERNGASVRACLESARYNATFVAPVELIQNLADAIALFEAEEAQPATLAEAADLLRRMLAIMDEAHSTVEQAWFHSEPLSEEEVYQRFVQQQQQQQPAAQTQTAGDQ